MKKLANISLLFLVLLTARGISQEYPLYQLKHFADGLNIEGGTIPRKYLKETQIWANLCVVLDRPFEEGLEWQDLTNSNVFPLKEASLQTYNEAQVNYAYALIMHYYLINAHQLVKKRKEETAKILIQVHRNTSGPSQIELLEKLLLTCYPELEGKKQKTSQLKHELFTYHFPELNVEASFCYGTLPENLGELGKYNEVDIVLSFSLVAGLHPEWESGSLLIPQEHIPFSLKKVALDKEEKYCVTNHLTQAVKEIVLSQEREVLEVINGVFLSDNPQKSLQRARVFELDDFKQAVLLQVDGMFNPSQLPEKFCKNEIKQ